MRFRAPRFIFLAALVQLAMSGGAARGEITIPAELSPVVDRANVIQADQKAYLERVLIELREKTTDEVKVLTVASIDDEDVFSFSQRHYELWKLGQKGKDNGALIVLAVKERKVRIHTGYDLEGTLPDSWIGTESRRVATQYFKSGQYSVGLVELTVATVKRIAAERGVTIDALAGAPVAPKPQPPGPEQTFPCCALLLPFAIFMLLAWLSNRRRRRRAWGGSLWDALFWSSVFNNMGGSNRGGWSGGGGGWGGGSFGGGGGFFGGGGSSGGGGGGASW